MRPAAARIPPRSKRIRALPLPGACASYSCCSMRNSLPASSVTRLSSRNATTTKASAPVSSVSPRNTAPPADSGRRLPSSDSATTSPFTNATRPTASGPPSASPSSPASSTQSCPHSRALKSVPRTPTVATGVRSSNASGRRRGTAPVTVRTPPRNRCSRILSSPSPSAYSSTRNTVCGRRIISVPSASSTIAKLPSPVVRTSWR